MVTQLLRQFRGNWCRIALTLFSSRHYVKPMLAIWESVNTILFTTAPQISSPIFLVKALSNPGGVKTIIIDNYDWIRRKVRNKSIQEDMSGDDLTTNRVVCFLNIWFNISLHTNWRSTRKFSRALTLTSSLIFMLIWLMGWLMISRRIGFCLGLMAYSSDLL